MIRKKWLNLWSNQQNLDLQFNKNKTVKPSWRWLEQAGGLLAKASHYNAAEHTEMKIPSAAKRCLF